MHSALSLLGTCLAIYLFALGAMYCFQRSLLYAPPHGYMSPQQFGADPALHELAVKTADGLDLKGWYAPATTKPLTIVMFHGNADSLRSASGVAKPYIAAGYGFLVAEYRGYGGMPGSLSEQGLYTDGRAYLKTLIASGVKEDSIVLFGYSLGSGVAVQMATEFKTRGLILLAPFLSVPKTAKAHYPIFPVEPLVWDRYENFRKIPGIHIPILMANGGMDRVVPPVQGKELFALANEPKEFFFAPDKGHNDIFSDGFIAVSLKWLARLAQDHSRE